MRTVGLQTHIWNNNLRSIILIVLYPFMILAIAWACAFAFGGVLGERAQLVSGLLMNWPRWQRNQPYPLLMLSLWGAGISLYWVSVCGLA